MSFFPLIQTYTHVSTSYVYVCLLLFVLTEEQIWCHTCFTYLAMNAKPSVEWSTFFSYKNVLDFKS